MGGVREGAAVVEVEVLVLSGSPTMESVRGVVVVFLEEVIIPPMKGAGGLEVGVLDEGVDEAEALEEGEIGVLLGEEALREGQRLNNGTRKGNTKGVSLKVITAVLGRGEIGAQLEKAVQREGQ